MTGDFIANGTVRNLSSLNSGEREAILSRGLHIYLTNIVGDYLSEEEIERLEGMLSDFRYRPSDVEYSSDLCRVVTEADELSNRNIPRKTLRKDEFAIFLYNISPYGLLNRKSTAMMAKCAFPNFFASVGTINSTFTKYVGACVTSTGKPISLSITNLPYHSTDEFEALLLNLALNFSDQTEEKL